MSERSIERAQAAVTVILPPVIDVTIVSPIPLPVTTTQLPALLVGGRLDTNIGAWLGSTAPTVGQKTAANSIPVVLASDQTVTETPSSTSSVTSVAASAGVVTLLVANATRLDATFFNDSDTEVLYLKLGAAASLVSYTVQIQPLAYYELPYRYTGIITGIWTAAVGNARITELTP